MTADLTYLTWSTLLTFVMLLSAAQIRVRGWTSDGVVRAFSNRTELPERTAMSARADRAANNMLESMVMFVAAIVVARLGGADAASIEQGAQLFFFARVAYWVVYLAGIPYLRTLLWGIGVYGTASVLFAGQ